MDSKIHVINEADSLLNEIVKYMKSVDAELNKINLVLMHLAEAMDNMNNKIKT